MSAYQDVLKSFKQIDRDPSWAFFEKTRKDTAYISHGYHRYPAKFIPQVVSRLIKKYSKEGDWVVDPFGGCGTTLIESKVMRRHSIGVDINPVAVLITKAKKTAIQPEILNEEFLKLKEKISSFDENNKLKTPRHERIDYWFKKDEKKKLSFLFSEISKIENAEIKNFFYCGFSNVLKNCSIWLQKSNKPTRDFHKTPAEPFMAFIRQINTMLRGNIDFYYLLRKDDNFYTSCEVYCADARKIPVKSNSVTLVVASPPYVTSYEYADLHQLTALWFEYMKDLNSFRKKFIGTAYHDKKDGNVNSQIAEHIQKKLVDKDKKTAIEVSTYFSEMNQVFQEMKRILKKGGRICLVIGNTSLKSVDVLNAEVFAEQLQNLGFKKDHIIKREIPSKILPSTRDKKTGRFSKVAHERKVFAYPTEYILVFKK
ncbi:MAG: DNA methyltransferase [Oligoflexia bacterium]|nr:DNA methyltransferase [Oligoflexia bacterium]